MGNKCPVCGSKEWYENRSEGFVWLECDACGHKIHLTSPKHMVVLSMNIEQAVTIGASRKLLRKRFMEAKSVMSRGLARLFTGAKLDFENKRFVGKGYALQWALRNHPDQPESYHNQQTNRGDVSLVRL